MHDATTSKSAVGSLAEASRPKRQIKAAEERDTVGRKRKHEPKDAVRRNWKNPQTWVMIEEAQRHVGSWRPCEITKHLSRVSPAIFGSLNQQVVGRWIDKTGPRPKWSKAVLEEVAHGNTPGGSTNRHPILKDCPDVVESIVSVLERLRSAGQALSATSIRGIIVAHIQHKKPEVFARRIRKDGTVFCASEPWVRRFVRKQLNWVMRKPTKAARKIPVEAPELIFILYLRISCSIRDAPITRPALIVNFDQTQVIYHLGGGLTYDVRGTKQVPVINHEEKRAFTLTVGVSLAGDLLPFHATFKGKSKQSLPKATAPKMNEANALGFVFDFSGNDSYWRTMDCLKNYVSSIVVPYWTRIKEENGLPPDQECILQLDIWAVHRSAEFREWMSENYPWIILEYIPGGCTGIWQACDVGIQRVLKLSIKRSQHQDIVVEIMDQLDDGTNPAETTLDTSLPTLRDRCVEWLVTAYGYVNKPEIVKKVSWLSTASPQIQIIDLFMV